jgi:hypothetical protein
MAYATVLLGAGCFDLRDLNYHGGFLIGWDRWSDGRPGYEYLPWPS